MEVSRVNLSIASACHEYGMKSHIIVSSWIGEGESRGIRLYRQTEQSFLVALFCFGFRGVRKHLSHTVRPLASADGYGR